MFGEKRGRFVSLFLILIIFGIFFVSFVSAATITDFTSGLSSFFSGIKEVSTVIINEVLKPAMEFIVGDSPSNEWFAAKILIFILLYTIISAALKNIPLFNGKIGLLRFIPAAIVTILAIRFVGTPDWMETILLPYSAMGIAISAGLPFIIYFFAIKGLSSSVRRAAWIFFGIIMFALFFYRYVELTFTTAWIYLATAFISFIMAAADGTINAWWGRIGAEKSLDGTKLKEVRNIDKQLNDCIDDFARDGEGYNPKTPGGKTLTGHAAFEADKKYLLNLRQNILK